MAITDELREFVEGHLYLGATVLGGWKEAALIIADHIDAAHESACAEAYGNGVMSVPIALDESAWVKLPVDADGVPIRVGDRLDGYNRTIGVQEMRWCGDCRWDVVDEYGDEWHDNYAFTHHHAPTVEDVLDEFFGKANLPDGTQTRAEIIAEYAKRLRLAGDDE